MESRNVVIACVGLFSYVAGIVQGVFTFGDAIAFHLFWHALVIIAPTIARSSPLGDRDLELVTLLLAMRSLSVQPAMARACWSDFRWTLTKFLLPMQTIGILGGAWFLRNHSADPRLRPTLGVVYLICALALLVEKVFSAAARNRKAAAVSATTVVAVPMEFHDDRKRGPDAVESGPPLANEEGGGETVASPTGSALLDLPATTTPHHVTAAGAASGAAVPSDATSEDPWRVVTPRCVMSFAAVGLLSGILAGVSGIGGPPLFVLIIYFALPPQVVRGTLPMCWMVIFCFRNTASLVAGDFRLECWPEYVAVLTGGVAGVVFGNVFGKKQSPSAFAAGVFTLLVVASLTMLDAPLWLDAVMGVGLMVWFHLWAIPRGVM